jgi:hypothetical protein
MSKRMLNRKREVKEEGELKKETVEGSQGGGRVKERASKEAVERKRKGSQRRL